MLSTVRVNQALPDGLWYKSPQPRAHSSHNDLCHSAKFELNQVSGQLLSVLKGRWALLLHNPSIPTAPLLLCIMPQHKANCNQTNNHQCAAQQALQARDCAGQAAGGVLCAPEVTQERRPAVVTCRSTQASGTHPQHDTVSCRRKGDVVTVHKAQNIMLGFHVETAVPC